MSRERGEVLMEGEGDHACVRVHACECVCVCTGEREREREKELTKFKAAVKKVCETFLLSSPTVASL